MLHLADPHGLLLRRSAVENGYDDDALRRAVRAGALVRIRQGAYCLAEVWRFSDEVARHRLRCRATLRIYGDEVALSHLSVAAWIGAPIVATTLEDVHLTSLDGRGARRQAGVRHHRGQLLVGDLSRMPEGWLTTPTRVALDVARSEPRDTAVCIIDHLLHAGATTIEALQQRLEGMQSWPGALHAFHVMSLVSGASESPGESLCRLWFRDQGLPAPIAQHEVRSADGRLLGRVDFAWPELGVIVEFDGKTKYRKHLRPGESVEEAVLREKRREDLIREATGWFVIRLTWADLHSPERTLARMMAAFARRAA